MNLYIISVIIDVIGIIIGIGIVILDYKDYSLIFGVIAILIGLIDLIFKKKIFSRLIL